MFASVQNGIKFTTEDFFVKLFDLAPQSTSCLRIYSGAVCFHLDFLEEIMCGGLITA